MFGGFLMLYFDRSKIAEVDVLNGWFWVTRREAIEEVLLFIHATYLPPSPAAVAKVLHWVSAPDGPPRLSGWYIPELTKAML